MTLSRTAIVDAAYLRLRERGLAGLSMRRLADDLGVQPGALYYYVASKQELLAAVAERILAGIPADPFPADPAFAADGIRAVLLGVRDSAEVLAFVRAYRPGALAPLDCLERAFAGRLPVDDAARAARALTSYLLGFVAEEQNFAELQHARIVSEQAADMYSDEAFRFGVAAFVRGLCS